MLLKNRIKRVVRRTYDGLANFVGRMVIRVFGKQQVAQAIQRAKAMYRFNPQRLVEAVRGSNSLLSPVVRWRLLIAILERLGTNLERLFGWCQQVGHLSRDADPRRCAQKIHLMCLTN